MATHDYVIANQGFPAFRSDLNNALAAIVSNNSSATEPTTMFAHMIWVDTAANPSILKIRNADNDAWITIGSLNQTADTFTLTSAVSATTLNTSGAVVFNDAGANVDFRVEGDTDANLLFVDASADAVGIGTSSPAVSGLEISKATGSATPTPVELRLATTTNASDWSTTDPWGRLSFYSFDESIGGAKIISAIDTIAYAANGGAANISFKNADTSSGALQERMRIDTSGNVGIGTSSPDATLQVLRAATTGEYLRVGANSGAPERSLRFSTFTVGSTVDVGHLINAPGNVSSAGGTLAFATNSAERMRIDSSGDVLVGKDVTTFGTAGVRVRGLGVVQITRDSNIPLEINRIGNDGNLVDFYQAGTLEGSISVSGTTVTYGGGHLARWAQLLDGSKDESIKKGTVLSNLDEMCVWSAPTTYWTEEDQLPVDEEGNPTVAVGDVKKEAYTADNEQCNKIKVSDVEGDANVAGVFVSWTYDDVHNTNDLFVAMTGDMIIRIAEGVTVARGDLLMSAGDGTAKPQGDDIVRSKTIAKVTSAHVTCTYDDGSYCVPCVLMAC